MNLRGAVLRETTPSSTAAYLDTIPNNCVRDNSVLLSDYGIGFSSRNPLFESRPDLIFLPCIYLFVSLLRTLFARQWLSVRKESSKPATKTISNHRKEIDRAGNRTSDLLLLSPLHYRLSYRSSSV